MQESSSVSSTASVACRPSSTGWQPNCRRLEWLPTTVQQLIIDYLLHDDVVALVVCAIEWPDAPPLSDRTLRCLWPRPILDVLVLHLAASSGCWQAVAWAQPRVPKRFKAELFPPWVMYEAVRRGDLTTIEVLHARCRYEPFVAMEIAGHAGDLELVEWFYQHSRSAKSPSASAVVIDLLAGREETASLGFEYVNWIVHIRAAKNNSSNRFCASRAGLLPHLPVLAASPKQRYPLFAYAVSVGNLELVDRLLQRAVRDNTVLSYEHTLSLAAANGKLEVVRWLLADNKASLNEIPQAMVSAAQHSHTEVLAFLHDSVIALGASLTLNLREQEQLRVAALHGHVAVVQYLVLRLRADITAQVFDNAARQGHKDLVIWLADHSGSDAILPTTILRAAVYGGNTQLVRWLVETRRYPVYREAAVHAAEENRLNVLKWLHNYASQQAAKEGRPTPQHILDYDSISLAALRCQGSIDCATWLLENVPWVDPAYSARDLRSLDQWYEAVLRRQLGSLHRNEPQSLDRYRLSDSQVTNCKGIDRFVMALIRHRPGVAAAVKWLPRWAVWMRSVEALQLLEAMNHSQLWSARTVRAALAFTTEVKLVTWLLRHGHVELNDDRREWRTVSHAVRKWASKHGLEEHATR